MKKRAWVSLIGAALLLVTVPSMSEAWGGGHGRSGGHGRVFIGSTFWWGPPYPYYYYPYPYVVYAPPPAPVIVERAPEYVQQAGVPRSYWYYCESAKVYYPNVPTCAEAWIKVAPRAE